MGTPVQNQGATGAWNDAISTASADATAKADAAQAAAIQRANQTGTQLLVTISDVTTAGGNIAKISNPSAITFLRINADNSVTTLSASAFLSAIGGIGGTSMSVDSGWTANSGAGDKTVALTNYANGLNGTMVTALNLTSSGTGTALSAGFDALVNLNKKFQALETVLVAAKLPNA